MIGVLFVLSALTLDTPFCDHAVLQREKPVVVRGSADAGATVSVSFAGNTVRGVADAAGRWSVKLPAMPASKEPRDLEVTAISPNNQTIKQSNNRTILHDILVGEVWLASGQSNMEMPLWHPTRKRFRDKMGGLMRQFPPPANLRLMMTWPERGVSATPRRDYPVAWTVPDETWLSSNKFSACAYYFGRELLTTLDVPVGVMAAFWGGTQIAPWVPDCGWESVKSEPYVATNILERVAKRVVLERENKRRKWPSYPGDLWNEQVAVFAPYTVRGMIWYQGESNIAENRLGLLDYSKNLRALMNGWRREFDCPDLKFLFVELAQFSYPWLELAENDDRLARLCDEQQRFEREEPDAHLACISDVGDPNDIHPCRKWEVGVRLAALAFQHVYGLPVRADPPRAVSARLVAPGKVEISLANAQGLYRWMPEVSPWTTNQHEVSPIRFVGQDGRIVDCESLVTNDMIVAESAQMDDPAEVTYLRRCTDEGNIYNDSALPLGTFKLKVEYLFADDLDYLKRKWREPCANPATGLEREAFQKAVEALVAERKDVEPWSFVKARVFALGCDRAAIGVSAHDWFPSFASWHYHRQHPMGGVVWRRSKEVDDMFTPGLRDSIDKAERSGQFTVWKDFDHCSPDWDRILALGFKGMKAELLRNWKETDYYKSKLIAIDAVFRFFDRVIAETEAEMKVAPGPRLEKELACLRRLRDGKPETAYDVLQFIYLFWVLNENFDRYQTRTLGNIDRLLTPYYRADLAAGRTTEAEFRDQLRHFWWQWGSINNYWGQPVYIGGTKADGTSEYNEVSKIILDVHDELNLPTPKMHLKIAKNTPEWVWRKTLDMMRRQRSLSFCGEEPIARVMKSCGYTAEEARNCIIWGCYEWGVRESANGTCAGHYNLLKNIELILADAKVGRFSAATFENFKREFYRRLGMSAREQIRLIQLSNAHLADVNPSNLFALSLAYSVEKGVEPLAGGTARGNGTAVQLIGFGTTVDALVAVKEIVYERKEMSLAELGQVMADDWKGHEDLRLRMLRSKRKWGNNDPTANTLCAELVKFCAAEYNGKPNSYGGGRFSASGHSSRQHIELGKSTGATPDGRKAGEEMSKNISPTMGADTEGSTALIDAVATLDARDLPGDFPLDVALLPRTVEGEKGLQLMRTLVETYFDNGGMVIQFNIQDAETLRDAQKHPEKYENLQVRVCGWNVRWNDIPKVEQDKFIIRQESIAQ